MKTTKITGLSCQIYQWSLGNCSAGGISATCKSVTLLDAGRSCGPVDPDASAPAVKLVRRNISGREYVHAEPVAPCPANACRMAGGAFIYSCDSRFNELVNNGGYPVSLHDRDEVQN